MNFLLPIGWVDITLACLGWAMGWGVFTFVLHHVCHWMMKTNHNYQALLPKNLHVDLTDRIISSLHASVVVIVVIVSFFTDADPFAEENLAFPECNTLVSIIPFSIGYMIVDIFVTLYMAAIGITMSDFITILVHHFLTLVAEISFLHLQIFPLLVRLLLLTEITTPILHARWMLIRFKFSESKVFWASMALMLGFIVFRVLGGVLMMGVALHIGLRDMARESLYATILFLVLGGVLLVLNSFWTFLMVRKAIQVMRHSKDVTVQEVMESGELADVVNVVESTSGDYHNLDSPSESSPV